MSIVPTATSRVRRSRRNVPDAVLTKRELLERASSTTSLATGTERNNGPPHTPGPAPAANALQMSLRNDVTVRLLRHSCGYYMNEEKDLRVMQDYLGHRDPKHTARYTRVVGRRFEGLWKR